MTQHSVLQKSFPDTPHSTEDQITDAGKPKSLFQEREQENRGLSPVSGVIHMSFDKKKNDPKKKKAQSSPFSIPWNPADKKDRSLFEKFFIFRNLFKGR